MLPLHNRRVVVTRPVSPSRALADRLAQLGARPIVFPTIRTESIGDRGFEGLSRSSGPFDWVVFTSAAGVAASWSDLVNSGLLKIAHSAKFAAVGPKTAESLVVRGVRPDLVPDRHTGVDLIDKLGDVEGQRVLLLRGDLAPRSIEVRIREKGAALTSLTVYRTVPVEPLPGAIRGLAHGFDAILFTSGSTVKNFCGMIDDRIRQIAESALVACIGPSTASAAEKEGLRVGIVASEFTTTGLLRALTSHFKSDAVPE